MALIVALIAVILIIAGVSLARYMWVTEMSRHRRIQLGWLGGFIDGAAIWAIVLALYLWLS